MKTFYWGRVKILSYLGHQLEYWLYISLAKLVSFFMGNFDMIKFDRFPFVAFALVYSWILAGATLNCQLLIHIFKKTYSFNPVKSSIIR